MSNANNPYPQPPNTDSERANYLRDHAHVPDPVPDPAPNSQATYVAARRMARIGHTARDAAWLALKASEYPAQIPHALAAADLALEAHKGGEPTPECLAAHAASHAAETPDGWRLASLRWDAAWGDRTG